MDIDRIRELAGIVSDRPSLFEGDDEIGKTIAQQMGGAGRIRMMTGAKQIVLLSNGLKIQFPNRERSKGNVCIVTLRPDDTYDMEFFNGTKSVKKYEGLYNDALVSTFEKQTGLYLKMSAGVPEGSKLEAHDEDEPEDDGEEGEPEEDDITTSDHHRWYQSGKLYFTGDEKGLRRKMNKDKFWPNVWFISDHGNAHLVTLEAAVRITKQGSQKGDCDKCGVNLRPGYGYKVDGTLLCVHCAEKQVGKDAVRAVDARLGEDFYDLTEDEKAPLGFKAKPVTVTVREVEKDSVNGGLQFRLSGAVYDQYLRDQIYSVNPGLERSTDVLLKAGFSEEEVEAIYADARSGVVTLRKPIKLKTTVFVRESVEEAANKGCECEGQEGCECEDTSRADMEKALWKWWPPDSKSTRGGKKRVMFTGNMAKAVGVMDYTTQPLSDLTDKQITKAYALLPKKEGVEVEEAKKGGKSAGGAWDGREVSIGTSVPPHAVTPRLLGKQVDKFKKLMGVCSSEGCSKIQGHSGSHTAAKESVDEASQTYVQAQQGIMAGLAKDGWTIKAGLKVPQALSPDASWKLFFKAQAIYLAKGDSDLGGARSLHLNDIRGGTYEKFKSDLARWTAEAVESVEVASEFRERAGLTGAHANWTLSEASPRLYGPSFTCATCLHHAQDHSTEKGSSECLDPRCDCKKFVPKKA